MFSPKIGTNLLLLFFLLCRGRGYTKIRVKKKVYSVQGVGGRAAAGGLIFFFNSVQGVGGGGGGGGGIGGPPITKNGVRGKGLVAGVWGVAVLCCVVCSGV